MAKSAIVELLRSVFESLFVVAVKCRRVIFASDFRRFPRGKLGVALNGNKRGAAPAPLSTRQTMLPTWRACCALP